MSRTNLQSRLLTSAAAAAAVFALSALPSAVQAVPVQGGYIDDPRCDPIPNQQLSHELGEQQFFPVNESFQVQVAPATFYICVPDDGIQNDWIVQITNTSGQSWKDLFFVAD